MAERLVRLPLAAQVLPLLQLWAPRPRQASQTSSAIGVPRFRRSASAMIETSLAARKCRRRQPPAPQEQRAPNFAADFGAAPRPSLHDPRHELRELNMRRCRLPCFECFVLRPDSNGLTWAVASSTLRFV